MPKSASDTKVMPNPSLERMTRRTFTAGYKLCIIKEANACQHVELETLLRGEKLYSNYEQIDV